MTPAEESLTAAWLAECWKPCRELPRHVRAADAAHTQHGQWAKLSVHVQLHRTAPAGAANTWPGA